MPSRLDAPGTIRRAAAGAWHIPGGAWFLARRPRLWAFALLPAVLCAVLVVSGLVLGLYVGPAVTGAFERSMAGLPDWLGLAMAIVLWMATLAAGAILGLGSALVLSAPVLEQLSRQVEAETGRAPATPPGTLRWEIAQSLRSAAYFAVRIPGILLLGFVPIVGLAVFPLQVVAWLLRGVVFQYIGLTALCAYVRLYRGSRVGLAPARALHGPATEQAS